MENYLEENRCSEIEESSVIEGLCTFLRNNQANAQLLNARRYREMMQAKELLEEVLADSGERAELTIRYEPLFQYAVLTAEMEELTVKPADEFEKAIRLTDGFEVYPLTNGHIRIAFLFRRMMKTI